MLQLDTTDDYNITTIHDRRLKYYNYTRQMTTILQLYTTDDFQFYNYTRQTTTILQLYTTNDYNITILHDRRLQYYN